MRQILFLLAVLAFTVAVQVYAADNVGGTWGLTMMGFQGEAESYDIAITQDGKKLDVTVTHSESQLMLSGAAGTGTFKGSKIKFSLKSPDNQFEFIFKGKVTGKMMEGTREIRQEGRGGTLEFIPPGKKLTEDEIKNLSIWNAVMK